MTRVLEPELLDALPASDPRALHSRRDLRRLNSIMGNARLLARFLKRFSGGERPLHVAEIGAGDGNVSLLLANVLPIRNLILVDRNPSTTAPPDGVAIEVVRADVLDWLEGAEPVDVIVANLFLHHFENDALRDLLRRCAERCECFVAAEPRRNRFAEWFAGRVGLIGCNDVTKHDAVISVRAGFNGREVSGLWPASSAWALTERRAGLFTHFFAAERK